MNKRQQVLDAIECLEALPVSATRLSGLLVNPEVRIDDVRHCVEQDPGLAANVLHICNSVAFAGRAAVTCVREAIVRLGTQRILNLALSQSTGPLRASSVAGYDLAGGELWHHSAAVAVAAETLAQVLGEHPAPETFTAGLLHDVGKLVIGIAVRDEMAPIFALVAEGASFEEAEMEVLGIDHAEAGALLLQRWGLPEALSYVARWHHAPDAAPAHSHTLDLVHVADILVLGFGIGAGNDGLHYRVSEQVAQRLALNSTVLETATCRMIDGLSVIGIDVLPAA